MPNLYTVQPFKFQVANQRVEGMYVSYTDFNPGLRTACVTEDGPGLSAIGYQTETARRQDAS